MIRCISRPKWTSPENLRGEGGRGGCPVCLRGSLSFAEIKCGRHCSLVGYSLAFSMGGCPLEVIGA